MENITNFLTIDQELFGIIFTKKMPKINIFQKSALHVQHVNIYKILTLKNQLDGKLFSLKGFQPHIENKNSNESKEKRKDNVI